MLNLRLAGTIVLLGTTSASAATVYTFDTATLPSITGSASNYQLLGGALAFTQSGVTSTGTAPAGSQAGSSLPRQFTTIGLDLRNENTVSFDLMIGNNNSFGGTTFENVDSGEDVRLFYSIDGGASFTSLTTISTSTEARFQGTFDTLVTSLPSAARTASTVLQIAQVNHSGSSFDHWAIDNLALGNVSVAPVPVPAPAALLATGLLGFGALRRRQR